MKTFIKWLQSFKKKKWECYEIYIIQAKVYGCNSQCKECKAKQEREGNH